MKGRNTAPGVLRIADCGNLNDVATLVRWSDIQKKYMGVFIIKILFVCLGNICRSPMAEAIFRHMCNEKGYGDAVTVSSRGTTDYNVGQPPHDGTREILAVHGMECAGIKASQLKAVHLAEFDYVIAMDRKNLADILELADEYSTADIRLLSDFAQSEWEEVPDPWYTGNFELTYELITEGCTMLLSHVEAEGLL